VWHGCAALIVPDTLTDGRPLSATAVAVTVSVEVSIALQHVSRANDMRYSRPDGQGPIIAHA
jgi:hypothetical protein